MNNATVDIIRASSPGHFDAARWLLARYLRWLEGILGNDLATVQPSSLLNGRPRR